jgi:hypothetical protein
VSAVIGTITITKSLDDEGRVMIDVDYEGMTIYEAIGILSVELDTQRDEAREARRG